MSTGHRQHTTDGEQDDNNLRSHCGRGRRDDVSFTEQAVTPGNLERFEPCGLCWPDGVDELLDDPCTPVRTLGGTGQMLHRPNACPHDSPTKDTNDGMPSRATEDDDRTLAEILEGGLSPDDLDEGTSEVLADCVREADAEDDPEVDTGEGIVTDGRGHARDIIARQRDLSRSNGNLPDDLDDRLDEDDEEVGELADSDGGED